ncbi:putative tetratricopeptide-like helical domain superfamily [Helianthus annuus]|uniref:Tetratricopeptide-like helical domain superfamily n=2 Tax=Helianthus annuus TaxID=4232 RepID=A0A9K3E5S0_HELAN|nr:pentatricopeptide repeat-containing protein At4g39952, mitochondrial [Helianthus annuus]KAF5767540.1 putative tetratricopeptide-like helical domain superfamily [Helianthus annuus]KAJ0484434.1 putative tetratricopeptide-like helical domain superfamily [Helianthus annuus]KAJ0654987.1 putative tetratricopeptide-like helical domain superfamily [Helianthus annuus]KAJ0658703.1 putative tetratricopeptide-like helical domain superfamily [Helianthus annuus]KAJ0838906.1 putative tetratricopeptide-lik
MKHHLLHTTSCSSYMYTYKKVISLCIHGRPHYHHHHFFHSSATTTNLILHHINNFLSLRPPTPLQTLTKHHAFIITTGNHSNNVFISSKLISLYANLHHPTSSTQVFHSFHGYKDIFLWNSIIQAHFSNAMYSQCLHFYNSMRVFTPLLPNQFTVPIVVSACSEIRDLVAGMIVHGLVFKVGLFDDSGASFVYMYSKCGCVESARQVFDEMPVRDVVAWTALVIGYVSNGESDNGLRCVFEMYRADERPNFRTLEGGFQACGDLEVVYAGRCLHGAAVKSGLGCSVPVKSSILSMYSKCGSLEEACLSFCEVDVKDIKSWTTIIGVYGKWGCVRRCLSGFMEMLAYGIIPDPMVVSCVISGLANSTCTSAGKTFHGFMVRRNYHQDQMVHNALVSMYCKFGLISYAENVFKSARILDKEVWNAMVHGYGKVRNGAKCINLFAKMLDFGLDPDPYSLVSALSSCSEVREMNIGRCLHGYAVKRLMNEHVSVSNSLIDMYGNIGELETAKRLFCRTDKDVITWNTMISTYTRHGRYSEAFSLFNKMILQGTKPTASTLISMLSACTHMASVEKGIQIHKYIEENQQEMLLSNVTVATALVDMYAKCGQLEKSKNIFKKMTERDVISWNVMISGYGLHGDATSAIDMFREMELSNVKPNELTFLALLSACNHAGLVDEGKSLFGRMVDYYSLKPSLKHYTCMVDLLGRSGDLGEAENLVLSMPVGVVPDGGLWGALLSACKIHNNHEMGTRIAKRAIECEPTNDGYYIILANLYDSIGMWEDAERVRKYMKERGVEKAVGWSAV